MANVHIIQRMMQIVDNHELGHITSQDVEREIESHMQALEKITLVEIRDSRQLTYRLALAHFSSGDIEYGSEESAATIRSELRDFLQSLPGAEE